MLPPVLAYHLVDRRMDAGIAWIPPRRFERQIAWLAEAGYRSLSVSEYLHHDIHSTEKSVAITFDDGYCSLTQYALSILSRYHFRATVFVIAAYVGRPNLWDVKFFLSRFRHLDWSELRELLAAGWEVGSHSLQHEYLPLLSEQELHEDLHRSRQILEENLQRPIIHLSLPFGRGNRRVYLAARETGFESVATLGSPDSRFKNPPERGFRQSAIATPKIRFPDCTSSLVAVFIFRIQCTVFGSVWRRHRTRNGNTGGNAPSARFPWARLSSKPSERNCITARLRITVRTVM